MVAEEAGCSGARFVGSTERAEHDDPLGFALLDEDAVRVARAMLLEQREGARGIAALACDVGATEEIGLGIERRRTRGHRRRGRRRFGGDPRRRWACGRGGRRRDVGPFVDDW